MNDRRGCDVHMETVVVCPICGGLGNDDVAIRDFRLDVPGSFSYCQCSRCNVYWLVNRFKRAENHRAYPQASYYSYNERPPPPSDWIQLAVDSRYRHKSSLLARIAGRLVQAYPPAGAPGSVLDVGCGTGARLSRLARAGWECAGVEADADAAATARMAGLDVQCGAAERLPFNDETFDAVIMAHSIEHCHDPRAAVREARRVCRTGGWIVVTTPNTRSFARWVWGRYWVHWEPSRHLVLFDRLSLLSLLGAEGFTVCSVRGTSSGAGWVDSAILRFKRPRSKQLTSLARMGGSVIGMLTNPFAWADEMEVVACKVGECQ